MVKKYIRGENNPVNTEVFNKILHGGFFFPLDYASRKCMPDGQWYVHPVLNRTWTNYSQCFNKKVITNEPKVGGILEVSGGCNTHLWSISRRLKSLHQIIYNICLAKLMKLPFHWYSSLMRMQHKKVVHFTFVCVHKQHIIFMIKIRV